MCRMKRRFQSTLPAWGETDRGTTDIDKIRISIHSPRMGRDSSISFACSSRSNDISIHSPRMGRDVQGKRANETYIDFNPLSPHGERRLHHGRFIEANQFQSTLPAWGETRSSWARRRTSGFQSTLPAWGETFR